MVGGIKTGRSQHNEINVRTGGEAHDLGAAIAVEDFGAPADSALLQLSTQPIQMLPRCLIDPAVEASFIFHG